ncbi:MAG: branched-chain amino acid ABC transporter permease [Chloroflexota bacterium]|nr:branched-chain amino acid ABC transporter permease [Chloroflexota bacterium]
MSVARLRDASVVSFLKIREQQSRLLAMALAVAIVAYIGWKIVQSPDQALQFAFNGLAVGAVYALLAMGFTFVYSTVWFFDLYYGAAAAIGAYGVFYLRSHDVLGGQYAVNSGPVNVLFAVVTAGVAAWALHVLCYRRFQGRAQPRTLLIIGGLLAAAVGVYTGLVLANPANLHVLLSPLVAVLVTGGATWVLRRGFQRVVAPATRGPLGAMVTVAIVVGVLVAILVANTPSLGLYLSWGVACLLSGTVSLALYRGLYVTMRERANSPLIMLVASLGILLAITAFITIVFRAAPRPLPEAFGSEPWTIGGANIKGFNVFAIGLAVAGFGVLLFLVKKTAFGKAVRAIGDDEEVAKVVGINTTVIIAVVFFIGAVYAALAGLVSGHDTAIQPRMGLLLLLKGWIASVVGGIGSLYGAIVGGFALGMLEQFGIWDLAGEWRDVISFIVLIVFLSFWPQGLLPRK